MIASPTVVPEMSALYVTRPPFWGLRGDPLLWDEMRQASAGRPLPDGPDALAAQIGRDFTALTGTTLDATPQALYLPRLDPGKGGMSAGCISGPFWRETVLPLLLSRFETVTKNP